MSVITLYKPLGMTPLAAMEQYRAAHPEYANSAMTYAGRLDPMAEGVLLVLTDDDRLRKDEFLVLNKEYRATIAFGVTSDSYDALGIVTNSGTVSVDEVVRAIPALAGIHHLPFPAYSSYKVQGKPLHWWAQQRRLAEIAIPTKTMEVKDVSDIAVDVQPSAQIVDEAIEKIALVTGDFRQAESIASWCAVAKNTDSLIVASCTLHVTSGTYIRSLAQELGEQLSCGALLLRLARIRVGEYSLENAVRLPA